MYHDQDHPGIKLGRWLKEARRNANFVGRVFSQKVKMNPAVYCEVELGVTSWLTLEDVEAISWALKLNPAEHDEWLKMFEAAKVATQLKFSDLYTRDELRPMPWTRSNGKPITFEQSEKIVDAVLKPIDPRLKYATGRQVG